MREKLRDASRLRHMLHAIENINRFLDGKNLNDFTDDSMLYYAVVKNLEIIGEAAYMLTGEYRDSHPATPWRVIVGMRHVLVHGYYQVDASEVWNTVRNNLPVLKLQLTDYLDECRE